MYGVGLRFYKQQHFYPKTFEFTTVVSCHHFQLWTFLSLLGNLMVNLWRHMERENWVNGNLGDGLLPNGTKPLHESMLTFD